MVEVLIAGAGPAGTAAAIVLARRGMRVLLVDRATFPRDKLCGDTVNPGAMVLLGRLGLAGPVAGSGLPLDGVRVTSPRGVEVRGQYPVTAAGRAIRRRDLDALLVAAADAAGAHVETGVRVVGPLLDTSGASPVVRGALLERAGRRLRVPAAMVVAADGRRSALAGALGLTVAPARPRRWAVGGYFSNVEGLGREGEMHVRASHYVGIAPLPGGLANVCLVTGDRRGLAAPGARLREALAVDPLLAGRFTHARLEGAATSLGPLAVESRAAGVTGLLLAGDAAGFLDPMTGDGVRLAVHGGLLAAEATLRLFDQPATDPLRWLADARRRAFGGKLRFDRALRALVPSAAGVRAGELVATLVPSLLRHAVWVAGDVSLADPLDDDLARCLAPTT